MDEISIAGYLNILEYIDEDKQEELLEMIGMGEKIQVVIEQNSSESKRECKSDMIKHMLNVHSLKETASFL